jgi:hypothetical protein
VLVASGGIKKVISLGTLATDSLNLCYVRPANVRQSWKDAMKSILLPVDQNEQMPSALETARFAADHFDSTVDGVALRPAFQEFIAADPVVAINMPPSDWNEVEFCKTVRQTFDAYAAQHPMKQNKGARFRWRGGSTIQDADLGSLARVYDLTVISRPGNRGGRLTSLEYALFESGRPVLMAPPTSPNSFGQTVLIHWNASTEVCRAISMAMPILCKAKRVMLFAVEGNIGSGPTAKDALVHLEAHGIAATEKTAGARGKRLLYKVRTVTAGPVLPGCGRAVSGAFAE